MKQQQEENGGEESEDQEEISDITSFLLSYTSLISISLALRDEENKTV